LSGTGFSLCGWFSLLNEMRIAIVSDIHGNRTAFEAVLADLRDTAPDLILHGGDLSDLGSSPVEVLDRIRDLGWPGVAGNTDEMLFRPESLQEFAQQSPNLQSLFETLEEMAVVSRQALGEERLAWLRSLPRSHTQGPMALVHASPQNLWRAPSPEASDADLDSLYSPLGQPVAVYGHVHCPFIRKVSNTLVVANSGSVGLPYDGDRRASYLLLDGSNPTIRRVEYDVERELKALSTCGLPHADWIARSIEHARPQMP
jgi:predicted phosphodiesterase